MSVEQLLTSPFAWCAIPAGVVKITNWRHPVTKAKLDEKDAVKLYEVAPFSLAKYPVTRAQYRQFIEAGGYQQSRFWTAEGWAMREQQAWSTPVGWEDARFGDLMQPVVGVTWFEARAFCRWLAAETNEVVTLPTEQQWQRAAQGDDERKYPWGNDWDVQKCNNNVDMFGIQKPTPVTQYEDKDVSPYGVVDMAGNVGEWCLTDYETGENHDGLANQRIMRGGSWINISEGDYTTIRRTHAPVAGARQPSLVWGGFRIANNLITHDE